MGFDLGSFLGGFADKVVEERDKATQSAKELAETTAKYHLQRAMEGKAEKDKQYRTALDYATKLRNYGYKNGQLLALAENGRLEDVLKYHDDKPGISISPDQVVTMASNLPEGTTFDDAFKKAVIGIPTAMDIKELMPQQERRGGFFMPDTSDIYRETADNIFSAAGMGMDEALQYSSDAFSRTTPTSKVDMSPFAKFGTDAKRTDATDIARAVSPYIAAKLGMDYETQISGDIIPRSDKQDKLLTFHRANSKLRVRAFELLSQGVTYDKALDTIGREIDSAEDLNKWASSTTTTTTSMQTPSDEQLRKEFEDAKAKDPDMEQLTFDQFKKLRTEPNTTIAVGEPTIEVPEFNWDTDPSGAAEDAIQFLKENGLTEEQEQFLGSLSGGQQKDEIQRALANITPVGTSGDTGGATGGEDVGGEDVGGSDPLPVHNTEMRQLLQLDPREFMQLTMGIKEYPTKDQVLDYLALMNTFYNNPDYTYMDAMSKAQAFMDLPPEQRVGFRSAEYNGISADEAAEMILKELEKARQQENEMPTANLSTGRMY